MMRSFCSQFAFLQVALPLLFHGVFRRSNGVNVGYLVIVNFYGNLRKDYNLQFQDFGLNMLLLLRVNPEYQNVCKPCWRRVRRIYCSTISFG